MEQSGFSARVARHLGRPVVAASVRPRATTLAVALGAGLGAGIGSIAGGSAIAAGAGGGLGVALGYLVLWLVTRGSGQSVGMALVLDEDRIELLRMNALGTRPLETLRSIPYADITAVEARDRLGLEVLIAIRAAGGDLELSGGRRGVGAAPPVIEELRRRTATERGTAVR